MSATIPAPAGEPTFLNGRRRRAELERLRETGVVDVLVIGGGVTGAGTALDAVTRGLSTVLVERDDLACGTSSYSSKLIHGGLRYLAKGQLDVAWESAQERHLLATVSAPHLVRALPQLTPVLAGGRGPAMALAAGIRAGDLMRRAAGTRASCLPAMRRVSGTEARLWTPALSDAGLRGGLLAWDGQLEDDARLVVALARTAAAHGASILTRCGAVAVEPGEVLLSDTLSGERFTVRARHVVNAAGVWAAGLAPGLSMSPSRGSHLVFDAARLGFPRAMLNVPLPGAFGRFVFLIPRADGTVIGGLTDEPLPGAPPDRVEVPQDDRTFLLEALSRVLSTPLRETDVIGAFAGMRPLLGGQGGAGTADLSRRHAVVVDPRTAMITVTGGKLTTYRRMAEDAVDVICARPGVAAGPCVTHRLALVGAAPAGVPAAANTPLGGLVRRFGAEAAELLALGRERPELLEPVVAGTDVLRVELVAAVQREGALGPADVFDRRTRLGLVDPLGREALLSGREVVERELAEQGIDGGGVEVAAGTAT